MSVATNNILNLLSELSSGADQIVEENALEFKLPRLSEWITLIEKKAESIAEGTAEGESEEIPSVLSYLRGTTSKRGGPRVSTVLTEIQRRHLHRKTLSKRQSVKTPLRRKSNAKVSAAHSENVQKEVDFHQNVIFNSTSSIQSKTPIATFTPHVLNKKGTTLKLNKKRSSKRNSSSELENTKKKPKIGGAINGDHPEEISVYSIEKKTKAKNSSLLPNYAKMKSSASATNVSNLKENILRSKIESKEDQAFENRKNVMALRMQKLEENKKAREEKIEKALQQRLKLEKQKLNKLRKSGGHEKSTTTPNPIYKIVTGNETLGESKGDKEGTSVKKLRLNLVKVGTSESSKSSEKTSVKKNQKKQAEKVLNATYVFSSKTVEKEKQPPTNNKGAVKDISETQTKTQKDIKGVKAIGSKKKLFESDSANTSTPLRKKASESYAITPAKSSFVSYDISEIRSDSEEEEQEVNSKPIPSWATGVRLRNALLQQHHHPIDTDELFGNFYEPPNLSVIMGLSKKQYKKRTSSAIWESSFSY